VGGDNRLLSWSIQTCLNGTIDSPLSDILINPNGDSEIDSVAVAFFEDQLAIVARGDHNIYRFAVSQDGTIARILATSDYDTADLHQITSMVFVGGDKLAISDSSSLRLIQLGPQDQGTILRSLKFPDDSVESAVSFALALRKRTCPIPADDDSDE
jgi:hypothetical protein